MKIKNLPWLVGLLQTITFLLYLAGVGAIMLNGNRWFGPMNAYPLLGPMLFLSLFVFSAIFSGVVLLGYPFYIFWEKKDFKTAVRIVGFTCVWILIFIVSSCLLLATRR